MVLRRRYQTMGFRVDDPWERELPREGRMTAYDPASGAPRDALRAATPTARPIPNGGRAATRRGRPCFPDPLSPAGRQLPTDDRLRRARQVLPHKDEGGRQPGANLGPDDEPARRTAHLAVIADSSLRSRP